MKTNWFKVPAIVVLSGSGTGNRIKTAAQLFHKGFGEKIIFSGFKVYPETTTSTLMKKYALKLGVPEKKYCDRNLGRRIKHSRRKHCQFKPTKKIKYYKVYPGYLYAPHKEGKINLSADYQAIRKGFRVFGCILPQIHRFPIQGWWKLRTGQISIFLEYLKSVAYYFDL